MKTILFTSAVWLTLAAACYGQVRAVEAGSAEAYELMRRQLQTLNLGPPVSIEQQIAARERKKKQIEYDKALDVGRSVFGADPRWTASRERAEGGTLIDKAPIDFAIGDWGCTSTPFRLISIISESEVLAMPMQDSTRVMLIRGLDTSKATDDIEFIIPRPVVIRRTYSYATASGAQKTVLGLEGNYPEFDEKIEDIRSRGWKVGKQSFVGAFVEITGGKARFWRKDKRTIVEFPLKRLSRDDQKYVRRASPWYPPSRSTVNRALAESGTSTNGKADGPLPATTRVALRPAVTKMTDTPNEPAPALVDRFVGRWRMTAENGSPAFLLRLDRSFSARKSHVPSATGKWEIVGDEAHITWSDGWTDILKVANGRAVKIAFAPGTSWNDKPANTQRAIKE